MADQVPISARLRAARRVNATTLAPAGVEALARLNVYKQANSTDVAYYRRVIREAPERALNLLLYKDMLHHEANMKVVAKQLPQVRKFYHAQPSEIRRLIDQRVAGVDPYYLDQAFVGAVQREMNRQQATVMSKAKTPKISPA